VEEILLRPAQYCSIDEPV